MSARPYLVEWLDSYGCSSNWEPLANCAPKPLLCRSLGWIVHRGPECVVIVPHIADEGPVKEQGCGDMTIPTAAILRMVPVKLPAPRKRAA